MLFSGTLRLNLDPFSRHTDEELWQAIEASHLKELASETENGLQFPIIEGGDNLRWQTNLSIQSLRFFNKPVFFKTLNTKPHKG